jgi:hypothetical protein
VRTGDTFGGRTRMSSSVNLNFGLDDFYNPSGVVVVDDQSDQSDQNDQPGQGNVPPQRTPSGGYRNIRAWTSADRFHQPTFTGMRSSGSRRRPPV